MLGLTTVRWAGTLNTVPNSAKMNAVLLRRGDKFFFIDLETWGNFEN